MEAALRLGKAPTEWLQVDPRDRALILTHLANEADKCPLCSHYMSDSTQPHMVAVDSVVCHTCAALDEHNKAHEKEPGELRFAYPAPEEPDVPTDE